jgi:hypothetical protein
VLGSEVSAKYPRYNSTVFETIAANNVNFFIVSPEFFTVKGSYYKIQYDVFELYLGKLNSGHESALPSSHVSVLKK